MRNDSRPAPSAATYLLLRTLASLVAVLVEIFGTAVFIGTRETAAYRAGYRPSWDATCVIAGVATVVFYVVDFSAVRSRARWVANVQHLSRRRRTELEREATVEELRSRNYGAGRVSLPIVLTPALWAFPLIIAGLASLPDDPKGGQSLGDFGIVILGLLLPITTLGLGTMTGRLLTRLSLAAWLPFAGCILSGHPGAAQVVGLAGFLGVLGALLATIAKRRRAVAKQNTEVREALLRIRQSSHPGA